jgi:orotidine-5'-phosphate decarboxylase
LVDDDTGELTLDGAPRELRARLALALDVDDLVAAQRLARQLAPWFGIAKVGLELYSAAGPDAVASMADLGFEVFCDLKLHDIPTTVARAACVLGGLGARYVTVHTSGGVDMVRAAVDACGQGASDGGWPAPITVGVTVLTSDAAPTRERLAERVAIAVEGGCRGVVCAAPDLAEVRALAPGLLTVVPGIRPEGTDHHDQARVATPADALTEGADILVVGRAVTAAPDVRAAAADFVAAALS